MSSKNLAQPTYPVLEVREVCHRVVYLPDGSRADMLTQVMFNMDKIGELIGVDRINRVLEAARKAKK